ncbi:AIR carboxylase family protein [Patescibacteria group bacterium]
MARRKIAVIHGSDSDLPQMRAGLELLEQAQNMDGQQIEVVDVYSCSVHRNPDCWTEFLESLESTSGNVDVVIAGAGWANHLTAMTDKWLRNFRANDHTIVVGVAFEDLKNPKHTEAAILSITEVPGHDIVFHDYVGASGFERACKFAISGKLPKIVKRAYKPSTIRDLQEALEKAHELATKP